MINNTETKKICGVALCLTLCVLCSLFLSVYITDNIKIGTSFIPLSITGMLFGPWYGMLVGGLADILQHILKPAGAYFPGFTLSSMLSGFTYGLLLHKKQKWYNIAGSKIIVSLVINLLLNTLWISMLYGKVFTILFPARLIKELTYLLFEIPALLFIVPAVKKIYKETII